ncbi:MAG: hypothetical protein FD170_338 [Bacteroidetes bacterium]|nr:MAG: hypothetical protein FD170_338 [Bacteroidota bacterium]
MPVISTGIFYLITVRFLQSQLLLYHIAHLLLKLFIVFPAPDAI